MPSESAKLEGLFRGLTKIDPSWPCVGSTGVWHVFRAKGRTYKVVYTGARLGRNSWKVSAVSALGWASLTTAFPEIEEWVRGVVMADRPMPVRQFLSGQAKVIDAYAKATRDLATLQAQVANLKAKVRKLPCGVWHLGENYALLVSEDSDAIHTKGRKHVEETGQEDNV